MQASAPSSQTCPTVQGEPLPPQVPPAQVSTAVQNRPSLQEAVLFAFWHPVAGMQESVVQTLPSLQLGAGPPTQDPAVQVSAVVHAFPSLQGSELLAC